MAVTTISINTPISFFEGSTSKTGKMTGIRDEFHIDILMDDGRVLRNVPHTLLGRHVGWYKSNPSEIVSFNSASSYKVNV